MCKPKTIKKTTPKQFETLVDFMTKNPNMAKGYHKNTERSLINEKWNDIQRKLNSIGPPSRETDGWMKVWADMKGSVKKKLVHNRSESRATGGGTFNQKLLTPLEEAVAGLLQMDSIINPEGLTFGIQSAPINISEESCDVPVDSEASEENITLEFQPDCQDRTTKRQSKAKKKYLLLEQQLKVQTDLYQDVKKSLSEIERYSRKTYKHQEDNLKVQKEKLKLC